MKYSYLKALYDEQKKTAGGEAYKDIKAIFQKAYELHKTHLENNCPNKDVAQSWRAVKGEILRN